MDVSVRTRHGYVPTSLRQEAQERVRKLERFELRPATAQLLFDQDSDGPRVETRLSVTGGVDIVASAVAPTFRVALARSIRRIERQLKRQRERYRNYSAPKVPSSS